jgi:enoyl-CoA hydratase
MRAYENLRLDVADSIATITIDRPDRLNALNRATLDELDHAVGLVDEDPGIRGALVTGSGSRAFVAGADIAELAEMGAVSGVQVSRLGQRVFRAIELSRKPYVAAVNGFALGGGCELALACHLRVAATTARFGLPEVKLGIIPGYGGTLRLPRIIGKGRALELILTGELIDAHEAYRIGLINRVVEPERLLAESRSLLSTILANGPVAVAMAIEVTTRGLEISLEDGLALESTSFGLLAATSDMKEGMAAFIGKRGANFTGE